MTSLPPSPPERREAPLLPCPFCGEEIPDDEFPVNVNEGIGNEHGGEATPWYEVGCRSCNFGIGARTEVEAIVAWNRRAPRLSEGAGEIINAAVDALPNADPPSLPGTLRIDGPGHVGYVRREHLREALLSAARAVPPGPPKEGTKNG